MPQFTLPLRSQGAIAEILVKINVFDLIRFRQLGRPIPHEVRLPAVLDTGSPLTCIDASAISSLGILPVGSIEVSTASSGPTPLTQDQYDVGLTLVHPSGHSALHAVFDDITITDLPLGHTGIPALIGCDLLDQWVFTYNGPARTYSVVY